MNLGPMRRLVGFLLLCLVISVICSVFIAFSTFSSCSCDKLQNDNLYQLNRISNWGPHQLAVIVPFRNRFEELLQFSPYIHRFLNNQQIRHKIYVINQVDNLRFNRASLINVGHLLSRSECDYLVMHDVDLLPLNPNLSYSYPESGPYHIAAPELHPRYHYSTFVGGILLLTREHFELVVTRPKGIVTGPKNTFLHIHDHKSRRRDTARLFNQKEATRRRDRLTGLTTVKYTVVNRHELVIGTAPVFVYNVKLVCNYTLTPWCEHKYIPKKL
ncbi:beta-1,4-galactosyltransferase 7-like [Centruroides sculpturatus]|uniref:beta-1,4-galactosyltransferase 7-like n=1 Tax=Centruroides sculpturatus TaxID=218467 RepID=UPI000C6E46C6|nr:beta-1,4-galactosyltransferase 7-like [Centruroides sculpturatus]